MSDAITTTAAPKPKPAPPVYKMPLPELGEIVHWYEGGLESRKQAAIVTQVDHNSVVCNIVAPNLKSMPIKDGVRHFNDPRAKDIDKIDNGLWDFTPLGKQLRALIAEFGDGIKPKV